MDARPLSAPLLALFLAAPALGGPSGRVELVPELKSPTGAPAQHGVKPLQLSPQGPSASLSPALFGAVPLAAPAADLVPISMPAAAAPEGAAPAAADSKPAGGESASASAALAFDGARALSADDAVAAFAAAAGRAPGAKPALAGHVGRVMRLGRRAGLDSSPVGTYLIDRVKRGKSIDYRKGVGVAGGVDKKGGVLTVTINGITHRVEKKSGVEIQPGNGPEGASRVYAQVAYSLLKGAALAAASDPAIKTVRIEAKKVMNKELEASFREFGFERRGDARWGELESTKPADWVLEVPVRSARAPAPPAPTARNGGFWHGTSWRDVSEAVLRSGGALSKEVTFVASAEHQAEPYARARARARSSTPLTLEFDARKIEDSVAFSGSPGRQYPAYRAREDLPLAALTESSKDALVDAAAREALDAPPPAARRLERALSAALARPVRAAREAPPARPLRALAEGLLSDKSVAAGARRSASLNHEQPASDAELLAVLAKALEPALRARGRELGFADAAEYSGWALSDRGAAERAEWERRLEVLGWSSGEMYSGFFRSRNGWVKATREYLDRAVAERVRSGRRELRLKSLGVGTGQEPYSLALLVEASLRAAGEDSAKWKIDIEAYDVNARSLWAVTRGAFERRAVFGVQTPFGGGVPEGYEALAAELFTGDERVVRASERLRSWMRPVFLNLNDKAQQEALAQTPGELLFANNTMIHMEHGASVELADRVLRGDWARPKSRALLNLSGMLVAELDPPGTRGPAVTLESSNPLEVLGGVSASGQITKVVLELGEKFKTGLGARPPFVIRVLRQFRRAAGWLAQPGALRLAPGIVRAASAHEKALSMTPSLQKELDEGLLAAAEEAAASRGLALRLHFDAGPGRLEGEALSLNAAWLFKEGPASAAEREEALARLLRRLTAGLPARAPPERETWDGGARGEGAVVAKGALDFGGTVRAVRFQDGSSLVWLSSRLFPSFGLKRVEAK